MKKIKLLLFFTTTLFFYTPTFAEKENIYTVKLLTDSNWTSIEIRDDAKFVIPPDNKPLELVAKKGGKSLTISEKRVHFIALTKGENELELFVQSQNQVLGLTICKGSRSSSTTVITNEGKHKIDIAEQDQCEKAALVLQLH